MSDSYVIIGDGIAGASAAETLREEAPDAEITVLTDEGESLYNRILIKEYAKGKLPRPRSRSIRNRGTTITMSTSGSTRSSSTSTSRTTRSTPTRETRSSTTPSCSRSAAPPAAPVGNADADGIHHFWTFQDARKIKQSVEDADRAVIVGAGLLGIDFAAICGAQDVEAKYLMRGDSWWRYALSEEGAEIMHDAMRERGVEPVFGSGVDHFEVDEDGHVEAAVDPNGDRYECDFAGVAIGLNFNTELVEDTSLETENGIVVDEFMRTNVDNVFAAGDITTFNDLVLGEQAKNGSWGRPSNRERSPLATCSSTAARSSSGSPRTRSLTSTSRSSPSAIRRSATTLSRRPPPRASGAAWLSKTGKSSAACSSATSRRSRRSNSSCARAAT